MTLGREVSLAYPVWRSSAVSDCKGWGSLTNLSASPIQYLQILLIRRDAALQGIIRHLNQFKYILILYRMQAFPGMYLITLTPPFPTRYNQVTFS